MTLCASDSNAIEPTWSNPQDCNKEATVLKTIQIFTDNNMLTFGDGEDYISIPMTQGILTDCGIFSNYDINTRIIWFLNNNSDAIYFMRKNKITARELIQAIMQEINRLQPPMKSQEANIEIKKINEEKPFIVVYKSKPIKGIQLELIGKNPNYNFKANEEHHSNITQNISKFAEAMRKTGFSRTELR